MVDSHSQDSFCKTTQQTDLAHISLLWIGRDTESNPHWCWLVSWASRIFLYISGANKEKIIWLAHATRCWFGMIGGHVIPICTYHCFAPRTIPGWGLWQLCSQTKEHNNALSCLHVSSMVWSYDTAVNTLWDIRNKYSEVCHNIMTCPLWLSIDTLITDPVRLANSSPTHTWQIPAVKLAPPEVTRHWLD